MVTCRAIWLKLRTSISTRTTGFRASSLISWNGFGFFVGTSSPSNMRAA